MHRACIMFPQFMVFSTHTPVLNGHTKAMQGCCCWTYVPWIERRQNQQQRWRHWHLWKGLMERLSIKRKVNINDRWKASAASVQCVHKSFCCTLHSALHPTSFHSGKHLAAILLFYLLINVPTFSDTSIRKKRKIKWSYSSQRVEG